MAQMAGVAGNFLDRFDTNTEEKRDLCLPLERTPPLGSQKVISAINRVDFPRVSLNMRVSGAFFGVLVQSQ